MHPVGWYRPHLTLRWLFSYSDTGFHFRELLGHDNRRAGSIHQQNTALSLVCALPFEVFIEPHKGANEFFTVDAYAFYFGVRARRVRRDFH